MRQWEQIFDGISQQMRGRMPNDFQALGVFGGDDGQLCVGLDGETRVHHFGIDLACQGGLGQARANGRGHFGHCDGATEFTQRTVGKCDLNHGQKRKKARLVPRLY